MLHRADVRAPPLEDDLPALRNRFGDAIDGIFHQEVGDAARARLDRLVPRRGERGGVIALAELVEGGGRVARDLRRHAHRARRGELCDEEALFLRGDARPAFGALLDGGEGELPGEVVGVDRGISLCVDDGGEGREDFLFHEVAPMVRWNFVNEPYGNNVGKPEFGEARPTPPRVRVGATRGEGAARRAPIFR